MSFLTFAILITVGSVTVIAVLGERLSKKWANQVVIVGGILMGYGWSWALGPVDGTLISRILFLAGGLGFAFLVMRFVRKAG